MQDPNETGPAGDALWKGRAIYAGRPGILITAEPDGHRDLWCYDPDRPVVADRPAAGLENDGWPFVILPASGSGTLTNNLAHMGEIPEGHHGRFPPNAAVRKLPDGWDNYEVRYASPGHGIRRIAVRLPADAVITASRLSSNAGELVDVLTWRNGDADRHLIARFAGGQPLPVRLGDGTTPPALASRGTARPLARLDYPVPPLTTAAVRLARLAAAGPAVPGHLRVSSASSARLKPR